MKSSFQTIIIIVFIFAFVVAVGIFSGVFSSNENRGSSTPQGIVTVWGTLDRSLMQEYIDTINGEGNGYTLDYIEIPSDQLVTSITNALADGNPPDLLLFPGELLVQLKNRLYPIPYASYNERAFRDTFIDGAQVFLARDGILGLPIFVDPLVTYYNKTLLAGASFVRPPNSWTTLVQTVPLFTKRDARGNIIQSTIALGESQNIARSTDILSTLFLQTGIPIVGYDPTTDKYEAELSFGQSSATEPLPAAQALLFYTSFSSTTNQGYSWNRSLPEALQMFLSGRSAFYLGRASELFTIQQQNPNLDFDVQEMFQLEGATRPITYGSYMAVGMLKAAPNSIAAFAALGAISRSADSDALSKIFSLPPARRDLLQTAQQNPYITVFFRSALNTFTWPNPNPSATVAAFRDMITNVTSGVMDANSAIDEANRDLQINIR
jgi:ABC-type glycerol-3-phosphate transport system substrate-binding protein